MGMSIWEILKNPDIRILIDSERLVNSVKFLGSIKDHFLRNQTLIDRYGSQYNENAWTKFEFTVKGRTRFDLKESTVSIGGVDVVKVGMHYDFIIADDLVSDQNVGTKEQVEKVIQHYRLLLSLLEPTGRIILIGTRWDYADLYGHIMAAEEDNFDILVKQAVSGSGKLLFPERLTEDFLAEQKISQGPYLFSCQYLNQPVDQENAIFKKSWLQYHEGVAQNGALVFPDGKRKPVNIFMTIDPAVSESRRADFSAIVVAAVDSENNLYMVDYMQERMLPNKLIDEIFRMYKKWRPQRVGVERVAAQRFFTLALPPEQKRQGIFFRLEELMPDVDKERRIQALQPMFAARSVWLKKGMKELEDQLLRFPFNVHDDLLDAFAYVRQMAYPKGKERKDKSQFAYAPLFKITGY